MNRSDSFFPSSNGKDRISYCIWEPEDISSVKCVLQISHGMCEYSDRYADFAEFLCGNGFAVGMNDHLGHGHSASSESELGYISAGDGPSELIDDLHSMTLVLKEKYPDVPIVLLGFSLGSFIARLYLSKYAEDIMAAVIMGTVGPGRPFGLGVTVCGLLSKLQGDRHRSKLITALAFGGYLKKCGKHASFTSWLTKDTGVLERRKNNPLCKFLFTLNGYKTMFGLLNLINNDEWAKTVPTDMPVLLISGEDDPVGDYGKGVSKVASMLGGAGLNKLTVRLFKGDRHELLNETDKADVYAYLLNWIENHLD